MPGYRIRSFLEQVIGGSILCAAVDQMHLWMARGSTGCGVDMQTAEIGGILQCGRDGNRSKVLVVEYCFFFKKRNYI